MSTSHSDRSGADPMTPRPSWRGARGEAARVVRHRWQRDWTTTLVERVRTRQRWQRLRLGVLLTAFLAASGWLAFLLLQAPSQIPFLAIVATNYEWPLAPNSWAAEDLDAIRKLDGRSIQLFDLSPSWSNRERGLRDFERQLADTPASGAAGNSLVVFISMHGTVDEQHRPCLVPPGASPWDSATWLPVSDVLDRLVAADPSPQRSWLVVLDCVRQPINVHCGWLSGTFAERVAEVVAAKGSSRLAVLCSAGDGEQSWVSRELQQSVFGRFLADGLAGRADDRAAGGNGDRRVTVTELHGYVTQRTGDWARHQRATRQQPVLIGSAGDFYVTWVLRRPPTHAPAARANLSAAQVRAVRELGQQAVADDYARVDPFGWQFWRHQRVSLEQQAQAGSAYSVASSRRLAEMQQQLNRIQSRVSQSVIQTSDVALQTAIRGEPWFVIEPQRAVSLGMARRIGGPANERLDLARLHLNALIADPRTQVIDRELDAITSLEQQSGLPRFAEVQLARILQRYVWRSQGMEDGMLAAAGARVLEVGMQAESVAHPRDIRVASWIRPLIDDADQQRRQAEDAVLGHDIDAALPAAQSAQELYRQAAELDQYVTAALSICDRTCAELADWISWLSDRDPISSDQPATDELIHAELLPCLADLGGLSRILDSGTAGTLDQSVIDRLQTDSARLNQHLAKLHDTLLTDAHTLLTADDKKSWPRAVGQIENLLKAPGLPSDLFEKLSDRRDDLAAELLRQLPAQSEQSASGAGASQLADATNATPASGGPAVPELLLERRAKRLRAMLAFGVELARDPSTSTPLSGSDDLAVLGGVWRQLLGEALKPNATSSMGRSLVEHRARLAAGFGRARPAEDPVMMARGRDWFHHGVWQASRSLDDLLGGPEVNGSPRFFQHAADQCLVLARSFDTHPTEGAAAEARAVDDRKNLLVRAAQNGLSAEAQDALVLFSDRPLQSRLEIRPGPGAEHFPASRLNVVLRTRTGEVVPSELREPGSSQPSHGIQLPIQSPQAVDLSCSMPQLSESLLSLAAHVRGNEFVDTVLVRAASGPQADWSAGESTTSRILLQGEGRRRPAVVFVLDCSRSMSDPVTVEDRPGTRTSRLELAKAALLTMLEQLVEERDAQVGVRLLGHRLALTTQAPVKLARQYGYGRPIPEDVAPHNDVEAILTLGRLDALAVGEVAQTLDKVQAWGQSPLYLAIQESLGDFPSGEQDADQNVIVITDGGNYQFVQSETGQVVAGETQTAEDVLRAAAGKSVRVHLVGFGISEREASRTSTEFQQIARRTQGSYVNVEGAARLVTRLQELLGPAEYTVTPGDLTRSPAPADSARSMHVRLGEPIAVPIQRERGETYTVRYRDFEEQLFLRGGEFIQLRPSSNRTQLITAPYDDQSPAFGRLVDSVTDEPTGWLLGAHRPLQKSNGLQIQVSLQREDRRFSRRPDELWIEATPVDAQGRAVGASHVFYDPVFLPETTVPVVEWTAHPWPPAANRVAIRAWVRSGPLTPDASLGPTSVPSARHPIEIPAIPGMRAIIEADQTLRDGEWEFRVGAWETVASGEFPDCRVWLATRDGFPIRPRGATRVFDPVGHATAHRFFLPSQVTLDNIQVQFARRQSFAAESQHLREPIVVETTEGPDLLQPNR